MFKIRPAAHADAANIIQAHIRSIRELCSADYTPEQIAAWSGRDFKIERWCETIDRDKVWVISNEKLEIFGFGHMSFTNENEAYVAGLYFVPEVKGQGFGKKMFQLMLSELGGRKLIKLNATKTAIKFYEAMGFSSSGCTAVQMLDQQIDCHVMQMQL